MVICIVTIYWRWCPHYQTVQSCAIRHTSYCPLSSCAIMQRGHKASQTVKGKIKVPLAQWPSGQWGVRAPSCLVHGMWKAGPNPLLSPPLIFPEVRYPFAAGWIVSFSVFWPELDSNLRPSAPQPSALTTWPRCLSSQTVLTNRQTNSLKFSLWGWSSRC